MSIPDAINARDFSALTHWVNDVRQRAPLLDDEADTLLARLRALQSQAQVIEALGAAPRTLGFYGHSGAGKAHLLCALADRQPGRLSVCPGGKHLDYLTHINPGNGATAMAVRFTPRDRDLPDGYPLVLRLLSEAELVQIFIASYSASGAARTLTDARMRQRLAPLRSLCQPQAHPAISADEVAALAAFWREQTPEREQSLSEESWHLIATLLPALTLNDRVRIYALLWGEQRDLTQQWLTLAQTLQLLGNVPEVAAPLSLLVDNFSLPSETFIPPGATHNGDVRVHPLDHNAVQPAVDLNSADLALLTAELTLPLVEATTPGDADLLDIPTGDETGGIAGVKTRWLLTCYRQRQQPDVLLLCNATHSRLAVAQTARALCRWVETTQPPQEGAQPNLVWAITPFDARFQAGQHLDEGVQRLLGKPGQSWGTLQALDARNLQRLTEWLALALGEARREQRLHALHARVARQTQALFQRYSGAREDDDAQAKSRAENGVRALQRQAARHGDLLEALMPTYSDSALPDDAPPGVRETAQELFSEAIDLFGEENPPAATPERSARQDGPNAHRLWVNHVRRWTQQEAHATALGLDAPTLRWLGETLTVASYRLDLGARLQAATDEAQRQAALARFLSWLGYADAPLSRRPASRINKGAVIFAPVTVQRERLTRLADQPVHAATRYVYDWLVALYAIACDNIGYRHPLDVSDEDREALNKALSGKPGLIP